MPAQHYHETAAGAGGEYDARRWLPALLAAGAAAAGRLPAFGAWWNQDDWGLLARAAGLIPAADLPVRWLSRVAYWSVMRPLGHLDPHPYAATRLVLLGFAAAGLARLAARLGLRPHQQLVAGLLLASTPLAFTPLYWAAGIQDLLALAAALWAWERWLAGGRAARAIAVALAVASLASKETFLGLPLLWAGWQRATAGRPGRRDLAILAGLGLAAAATAGLALHGFGGEALDPYARGGPLTPLLNLGIYGWFLVFPGPVYPALLAPWMLAVGGAAWLAGGVWGALAWRRGRRVPALAVAGALLAVAPALPLARHVDPYLALGSAACIALLLADLVPRRWRFSAPVTGVVVLAATAWGLFGMSARLDRRDADGLPADPLVKRTAVAHLAAAHLRAAVPAAREGTGLILLQPPVSPEAATLAADLGERWVTGSLLHRSLEGTLGPRLLLGPDVPVAWANGLLAAPATAVVLVDAGARFVPWGPTPQALLYQTLTDVGRGLFTRARGHLVRAGAMNGETVAFFYDPGAMVVSADRVRANAPAFLASLAARTDPAGRRVPDNPLQQLFRHLCAAADVAVAGGAASSRN